LSENAKLLFISVDLWYRGLPNNTAVLAVDIDIVVASKDT